jgi:DNA-binding MarR family transcriptional regulator
MPEEEDVRRVTWSVLVASRVLVGVAARSLAAVADQVTLPQFRLLVVLSNSAPLRSGQLADALGVHPSTATRMVDRLSADGLVDRDLNPDNRREVILSLSDRGARLVEDVSSRRQEQIRAIVSAMPPQQRNRLVAALEAFNVAAGEPGAEAVVAPLGWA